MAAKKHTKKIEPETKAVRINFNMPVDMPSVYATNILLQKMEHEVLISFYELQPPIFLNEAKQAENAKILEMSGIRADCVAKVIVANERFAAFADVIKKLATQMKTDEKMEKDA
ncbi:hypothetical protein BH20ACI2_BH20ACI2_23440 [soil metagenome]